MPLPPRWRKVVLTTHITTSVGWLGAVVAYLALDVIASTGHDADSARASYVAMGALVTYVVVPFALASVTIGIVNALGTPWGLLRHYWVVTKLVLTLVATGVLLIEAQTVTSLADQAGAGADPRDLPGTLPHSIGGILVLTTIAVLSVFKPRGVTPYGWRAQQRRSSSIARRAEVAR